MLGVTLAPTRISASAKINVIPSSAVLSVDCRVPPGLGEERGLARIHEVLGADGYRLEFTEQVVGNASPVSSPLMDAITAWVGEHDPGARVVPTILPGFTDSRTFRDAFPECVAYGFFPQRHMTLYETSPLIHAPTSASTCATSASRRRASATSRKELLAVTEAKLRLGGMALRNGLLVHGPTHWAAAVRRDDGTIAVASGRKPRLQGVDKVAGVRGVVRLGEAMPVIPLVKRALPEAQLPFQDVKVLGAMAAAAAGGRVLRGR